MEARAALVASQMLAQLMTMTVHLPRRTMATQLLMHERIETTLPKAKELRKTAEKLITWGKQVPPGVATSLRVQLQGLMQQGMQGDIAARRRAQGLLFDERATHKLFTIMAERYKERDGGYTRIMRTRLRGGDVAQMAYIECAPAQPTGHSIS